MQEKPASTIMSHFARPLWQKYGEQGFGGKPYIRFGPMLSAVGYLLFQTGGLLGYGLNGYPELMAKLLLKPILPEAIEVTLELALKPLGVDQIAKAHTLTNAKDKSVTLFELYLTPELATAGIDLSNSEFVLGRKARWAKEKIKAEAVELLSYLAFQKGSSIGFFFSKEFRAYWERSYRKRPENEWRDAYRHGVVSSPSQVDLSLPEEVSKVLREAADWGYRLSNHLGIAENGKLINLAREFERMAG